MLGLFESPLKIKKFQKTDAGQDYQHFLSNKDSVSDRVLTY